jgi:hypothetical protein
VEDRVAVRGAVERVRVALGEDIGQAAIEPLLLAGVIVALVAALITGFRAIMPGVVGQVCPIVDAAPAPPALAPETPVPAAPSTCFGP